MLKSNQCACNYSNSRFKILTAALSQFHLSLLKAVYISRKKKDLWWQKQFVFTRGGVEGTRLEAKAKDPKKIRGQGQPFRGQTLSRPRTGMLEAKDTSASALQKKKERSSQKFFRRSPKKKRSSQKFFKRSTQKNAFQKIFQALSKILTIQKILLSSSRGQANFRGLEASRPRPRTSKCVLEAKDVLEDSTFGIYSSTVSIGSEPAVSG